MTSVVTFSNTLEKQARTIKSSGLEKVAGKSSGHEKVCRANERTLPAPEEKAMRKNAGKENKTLENVLETPGNDFE